MYERKYDWPEFCSSYTTGFLVNSNKILASSTGTFWLACVSLEICSIQPNVCSVHDLQSRSTESSHDRVNERKPVSLSSFSSSGTIVRRSFENLWSGKYVQYGLLMRPRPRLRNDLTFERPDRGPVCHSSGVQLHNNRGGSASRPEWRSWATIGVESIVSREW